MPLVSVPVPRFAPYMRAASAHAPELYRKGKKGKNICK